METDHKILLVDDEKDIVDLIEEALQKEGFHDIRKACTGTDALQICRDFQPDVIVLDIMLPDIDGLEVCRQIRLFSYCSILFLSSKNDDVDKILGLSWGGDDYITKPFKLAIFMSRINALLRRSDNFNQADMELSSGGITIQLLKREVYKNNEKIDLTANEYKLLCLLMENPGQVLSPEQILGKLWDCNEDYVDSNTLTVYIRRLRTKIEENPGKPKRIVTVRRMGYKWDSTE